MNKILLSTCLATLSVLTAAPCLAAGSPWNGTWKENLSKSKLTGDTVVVTEKPDGTFHYSAGGILEYDFTCDGKPHPTIADRTITCTGNPESGYDFIGTTASGVVLNKIHRSFSADGKTMTANGTTMHPDGTTTSFQIVSQRQTGTTGLAGKWLDVKSQQGTAAVETWSLNDGTLHIDVPASKGTIDAKLDGSEGKISGPTVPPGVAIAFKPDGQNKLTYTVTLNGQTVSQGIYTVTADGKTLTDENWIPGRESEKSTEVWDKQ